MYIFVYIYIYINIYKYIYYDIMMWYKVAWLYAALSIHHLTYLPPTLRKSNALFKKCDKFNTKKHKFIGVLLTVCLLSLLVANTILFAYVCYFFWIVQKVLFFTCHRSQGVFSKYVFGIRYYFFELPFCLVAVLMPEFMSFVYLWYMYVSLYADIPVCEIFMLRFRNFGGTWYKYCGTWRGKSAYPYVAKPQRAVWKFKKFKTQKPT